MSGCPESDYGARCGAAKGEMSGHAYEYKLAFYKQIDDLLQDGWEPVPDVPVVYASGLNGTPQASPYVFLRRAYVCAGSPSSLGETRG